MPEENNNPVPAQDAPVMDAPAMDAPEMPEAPEAPAEGEVAAA